MQLQLIENVFHNMISPDFSVPHFFGSYSFLMKINYTVKTKRLFDSHMVKKLVYKKKQRLRSIFCQSGIILKSTLYFWCCFSWLFFSGLSFPHLLHEVEMLMYLEVSTLPSPLGYNLTLN